MRDNATSAGALNALPPDADNSELFTPEFKTVQMDGRRKGIKLERIFWSLIDELAARRGVKRAGLISDILNAESDNDANAASVLRCYVANELSQARSELSGKLEAINVINLLQTAPLPAFAINRQKKLVQVNPEFVQVVRVVSGNMSGNPQPDASQLTLDIPVDQLFQELNAGNEWTQCGYSISADGRQRRGRAKIVSVPTFAASVLVGYLIS